VAHTVVRRRDLRRTESLSGESAAVGGERQKRRAMRLPRRRRLVSELFETEIPRDMHVSLPLSR
jgi:hypothetical protein